MLITRNSLQTTPGPSEWFTGAVYIETLATPSDASRLQASSVHITPGARTERGTPTPTGRPSTSPRA